MTDEPINLLVKAELRNYYRGLRKKLSVLEQNDAARLAAWNLSQTNWFLTSVNIACYYALADELNTQTLIQYIWGAGKNCYLPVLDPSDSSELTFVSYLQDDKLTVNRYGILEPAMHKSIAASNLDLIVLPLIAFDRAGHRLGSGKGYYDRTFAFLREAVRSHSTLIGFAYAIQEGKNIPTDCWDLDLHGIVTEKEVIIAK